MLPEMVSGECPRAGPGPGGGLSPRCGGFDETGNDFLFPYLDSTEEQLLERLDYDELKLDAGKRLRFHQRVPLREGFVSPDHVMEDWYQLVPAFVATQGAEELQELEGAAVLLEAIEEKDDVSLTEADRVYLTVLRA